LAAGPKKKGSCRKTGLKGSGPIEALLRRVTSAEGDRWGLASLTRWFLRMRAIKCEKGIWWMPWR
jgi:hypothetical protein